MQASGNARWQWAAAHVAKLSSDPARRAAAQQAAAQRAQRSAAPAPYCNLISHAMLTRAQAPNSSGISPLLPPAAVALVALPRSAAPLLPLIALPLDELRRAT